MKRLLAGALCALMTSFPALAQRADGPPPHRGERMERTAPHPGAGPAPGRGDRNIERGQERRAERFQYRSERPSRPERRADHYRGERPRYDRGRVDNGYRYGAGRGYAQGRFGYGRGPWYATPYRSWARGQYIPRGYWSGGWSPYMIADWRGYGLYPPPRGHGWVRYHDDLLLIMLANGLIREILRDGWQDRRDRYDDGYYDYDPRY